MNVAYDADEDTRNGSPCLTDADVLGLYPHSRAASAAKWTATVDPDGGPNSDDD